MLILIHGNDVVGSRKALEQEKTDSDPAEKVFLDGKKTELAEIVTAVSSDSLFSQAKTIIIENLFYRGLNKGKENILSFLQKNQTAHKIIFWEPDEVSPATLRKFFAKARIIRCQLPFILFRFLDSIGSTSTATLLSCFHTILKQQDAELIYSMLLRQFRFLILAKDLKEKGFPSIPSWQSQKFLKQSQFFTLETLIKDYRKLLLLEYQLKSGQTPYKFTQLLDIFLATV